MNAHSESLNRSTFSSAEYGFGCCDAHVHIFDPGHFPYAEGRPYTPGKASREKLAAFLRSMGSQRVVIVQPSVYGTDNACLLDGLRFFEGSARGVAVVDPNQVSEEELFALKAAGVHALRVNFEAGANLRVDRGAAIKATALVAANHGLKVQVFSKLAATVPVLQAVEDLGVELILDHFAGLDPSLTYRHSDFRALLDAARRGRVWIKFSAPSRISSDPDYGDLKPFVQALVDAAPDKLVWASDWPHTGGGRERSARSIAEVEPFCEIDDRKSLEQLKTWIGDREIIRKVLVENPAKLFDF